MLSSHFYYPISIIPGLNGIVLLRLITIQGLCSGSYSVHYGDFLIRQLKLGSKNKRASKGISYDKIRSQ